MIWVMVAELVVMEALAFFWACSRVRSLGVGFDFAGALGFGFAAGFAGVVDLLVPAMVGFSLFFVPCFNRPYLNIQNKSSHSNTFFKCFECFTPAGEREGGVPAHDLLDAVSFACP
jgi:hypothetical protein